MFKIYKNKVNIVFIIIAIVIIGIIYYICNNNISADEEDILKSSKQSNGNEELENKVFVEKNDNKIIIHISGAVQKEGIIEIKEESRIYDVIEKAGGLKENACIKDINLASKVEDGEKIYIPTQEEYDNSEKTEQNYNINEKTNTKNNKTKSNKVNINTANQSELETLPGIGSSTALKIITYRNENGKFKNIDDIKKVNGIGENKFKDIKDLIII